MPFQSAPPNLFRFAPRELSQDAFIAWLASWACPSQAHENRPLHQTGQKLLEALFACHGVAAPAGPTIVRARCQVDRIDVLIEIDTTYAILIEDKLYSAEHSDQLRRYATRLTAEKAKTECTVLPIYFKTGDQSNLRAVFDSGYRVFDRQAFLRVLEFGMAQGVTSDIFRDYYTWLQSLEDAVEAFRVTPLSVWTAAQWTGFFKALQATGVFSGCGWDYVPNRQGGFMGFWWGNLKIAPDCHLYLQLEEQKLCFKIAVPETMADADRRALQSAWNQRIITAADESGLSVHARHLRPGRWMTVASVAGDIRQTSSAAPDILDFTETLNLMQRAEAVARSALHPADSTTQ
jgi:hypothetical protein